MLLCATRTSSSPGVSASTCIASMPAQYPWSSSWMRKARNAASCVIGERGSLLRGRILDLDRFQRLLVDHRHPPGIDLPRAPVGLHVYRPLVGQAGEDMEQRRRRRELAGDHEADAVLGQRQFQAAVGLLEMPCLAALRGRRELVEAAEQV